MLDTTWALCHTRFCSALYHLWTMLLTYEAPEVKQVLCVQKLPWCSVEHPRQRSFLIFSLNTSWIQWSLKHKYLVVFILLLQAFVKANCYTSKTLYFNSSKKLLEQQCFNTRPFAELGQLVSVIEILEIKFEC